MKSLPENIKVTGMFRLLLAFHSNKPEIYFHPTDLFTENWKHRAKIFQIFEMGAYGRLMPFRPLFPCVPWPRGTNNITLK